MEKVRIGVVGVGAISGIYLENITARFRELEIVGVCDPVSYTHLTLPTILLV